MNIVQLTMGFATFILSFSVMVVLSAINGRLDDDFVLILLLSLICGCVFALIRRIIDKKLDKK